MAGRGPAPVAQRQAALPMARSRRRRLGSVPRQPRQSLRRGHHVLQLSRAVPAGPACGLSARLRAAAQPGSAEHDPRQHHREHPGRIRRHPQEFDQRGDQGPHQRGHPGAGRSAAHRPRLDREPPRGDQRDVGRHAAGEELLPGEARQSRRAGRAGPGRHRVDRPDRARQRVHRQDPAGRGPRSRCRRAAARPGVRHRARRRRRHAHLRLAGRTPARRGYAGRSGVSRRTARRHRIRGAQDHRAPTTSRG